MNRRKLVYAGIFALAVYLAWNMFSGVPVVNENPGGTNIIAFGDSLTYGTGAARGEDYPSQLSRMAGVDIINAGVPGDTSARALARLERDVLQYDPKIVIVLLGGNDLLQQLPVTQTFENLDTIVSRIQDKGALVVLLGVKGFFLSDTHGAEYKNLARKRGTLYVPDVLSGILTHPKLKADQVHPNAAGYKLIAERVHKVLKPYLN